MNEKKHLTYEGSVIEHLSNDKEISIKDMIKSLGMTQKEFSDTFKIPIGTLRHWISGERECPEYTKRMLAYIVAMKKFEDGNGGTL